jgi:hypothetical protein
MRPDDLGGAFGVGADVPFHGRELGEKDGHARRLRHRGLRSIYGVPERRDVVV